MNKLDHTRRRIMRVFRLDEISAVDNPAQAHARMKILKREDDTMPWQPSDAQGHTKKADTPEKQKRWAAIANAALADKGDEGYAIRVANAAIGKAAGETEGGETIAALIAKYDEPYWKREFSEEERRSDAESGAAEPDGCVTGDTPIITKAGTFPIAELVGAEVDVLTSDSEWFGRWEKATIASYGRKPVVEIEFACGPAMFSVKASLGHRWILSDGTEVMTRDLSQGDTIPFISGTACALTCAAIPDHEPLCGAINGCKEESRQAGRASMPDVRQTASSHRVLCRERVQRAEISDTRLQGMFEEKVPEEILQPPTHFIAKNARTKTDADMLALRRDATAECLFLEKKGRSLSSRLQELRQKESASICQGASRGDFREEQKKEIALLRSRAGGLRRDAEEAGSGLRSLRQGGRDGALESIGDRSLPYDLDGARPSLSQLQYESRLGGTHRPGEDPEVPCWFITKIGRIQEAEEVFCATVPETGTFVLGPGLLTGNSFPIKTATDLHNAMRAIGRSKNPARTKAHIRARAKALGLESELSDAFKRSLVTDVVDAFWGGRLGKARAALLKSIRSIVDADDETVDKAAMLDRTVDEFTAHMAELSADLTKALSGGSPDAPEEIEMSAELKKALGLPADATADQITAAVAKLTGAAEKAKDDEIAKLRKEAADLKARLEKAEMTEEERAHHDGLEDDEAKAKFRRAEHAERREMMRKRGGDALVESLELAKVQSEKEALAKRVAQLEDDAQLALFTKRVEAMGLPASKGKAFMTMCKNAKTPEEKAAVEEFEKDMTSAIAAAKEGGVFKEFGANGRDVVMTPYEELVAKATELRKTQPQLTEAQAFAKVYADPANKKLVQAERLAKFSGGNEAA